MISTVFNILKRASVNPPADHRFLFDQSESPIPGTGLIIERPLRQERFSLQ